MKILNYIIQPVIFVIAVPCGIITSWVGVTVAVFEDIILTIKKEYVEHTKYPEWSKKQLAIHKNSREKSLKELVYADENILNEDLKLPPLPLSILMGILSSIAAYPIYLFMAVIYSPMKMHHLINEKLSFKNKPMFKKIKRSKLPTIMVVEDEIDMSNYVCSIIENTKKYNVVKAFNGKDALAMIKANSRFMGYARNRIKCVIMDIKMPEMTGLEFLKELRKKEYYPTIMPAIVLSAYEDADKWLEATSTDSGYVCHYIRKPLDKKHFLETLERIFAGEMHYMIEETRKQSYEKIHELNRES
ncbi:MAG: response regulator [Candidatus Margulisbacteria bacterium]|nr:response regulator [Candidatus Margulisiibacteriota bacterium]